MEDLDFEDVNTQHITINNLNYKLIDRWIRVDKKWTQCLKSL